MIIRYRRWQGIAAVVLSFSSTTAWAQLPSPGVSPLNQLGRSWGFGLSDGYHECPEPKVKQGFPRAVTPAKTVSHAVPCVDCEKKQSFFSKMNPFKDTVHQGTPSACGTSVGGGMTILPPSPSMYQQFAAPHETPLPGANGQSNSSHSPSDQMLPDHSGTSGQGASPVFGGQVPDPLELNSLESPSLQSESSESFQSDTVPPPPALRKRQKGDKPLGEEEDSKPPRERVPADRTDDKPGSKTDDSLDLLPKEEPPPITVHPKSDTRRSLISHATKIPETQPAHPVLSSQEAMLRQYYGQAYFRQEQPAATEVVPVLQTRSEPIRSTVNRYR